MSSPNSLRSHRLSNSAQFGQIASQGKRTVSGSLVMKQIPSPDGVYRLAFVVRKKCGNAVFRNRVRRILRHRFYSQLVKASGPSWSLLQYQGSQQNFQTEVLHRDTEMLFHKLGWLA
ncbi:MAG TPA: ribonuclease P protein component [Fibrobacteraceae bacterium]|nr:ribonuclease P protein component [Fibrobacteraceae bacterium]